MEKDQFYTCSRAHVLMCSCLPALLRSRLLPFILTTLSLLYDPFSTYYCYSQGSCCDLPGWQYYSIITIDNTCCAVSYTDRGYLIEVNTQALISSGLMNPSASDIRFKDGFCNPALLDYCLESGVNTPNTLIWVKLPLLPANGVTQIFMFYGNTTASPAQNCASIFQNILTVNSTVSLSGVQIYDEIDIQGGGVINIPSGSILELNALRITMSGTINGNNAGYGPQSGPGAGTNGGGGVGGSGGSYGGSGGSGGGGVPGPYGTTSGTDIDMGSGGGGSDCAPSAAGGGAVKLVADFINLTGTITMNGQQAANCCCGNSSEAAGGGAGGGIYIQCDYCSGNGSLSARGGRGGDSDTKEGGGGGGGGRIKICYSKTNSFSGTTDAAGGQPGVGPQSGETAGQAGTVSFFSCTEAALTFGPTQPVVIVPVAAFAAANICEDDTAFFTDNSTITPPAAIVSWSWNFGDGFTSTLQDPTHIYQNYGTFNVQLAVVSDSGCTDTIVTPVTVGPFPSTDFTVTPVCANDTALFNNLTTIATGSVTYSWNFGDASTSTLQNPTHIYSLDNTYNVTLAASSNMGCVNSVAKPLIIFPVPQAFFTVNNVCQDQTAVFDNTTSITGGNVNYGWDFGDGTNSFVEDPTHNYANPGTYVVILGALSTFNCADTAMRTVTIYPEPIANFTTANVCMNNPALFTSTTILSGGSITGYQWNFGDGMGTSVLQSPNYVYSAAGTYNVQLIVTSDMSCQDTVAKSIRIFSLPVADFTFTEACFGQPNNFTDASSISSDTLITWIWDFGDASSMVSQNAFRTYAATGTYNVELAVTSINGCKDSITKSVSVNPVPVADFSTNNVCLKNDAFFMDLSTVASPGVITDYTWDFGDGAGASSQPSPTYEYAADGTYLVTLEVLTDKGCYDSVNKSITIYPSPAAGFTVIQACDGFPASFTDTSMVINDIIIGWEWDFDDASPYDTTQNPQHTYTPAGFYTVRFVVFSASGCSDTLFKSVEAYPNPSAFFSTTSVCQGDITQFTDNSTVNPPGTIVSWNWDFGDGSGSSTLQDPSYSYLLYGLYSSVLSVTTADGCTNTYTGNARVYALPDILFTANPVRGCEPLTIQITDYSTVADALATGNNIATYIWNFGDASSSAASNPIHTYWEDGSYTMDVEITTVYGCEELQTISNYIIVDPLPVAGFSAYPQPTTILGSKIYFYDQSDLAAIWSWNFGDGDTSDLVSPVHLYGDTGNYPVYLKVTTVNGCVDDTTKIIRIDPDFTLFAPNAFSPNGDGKNEYFLTPVLYPLKYDMYIFDRWGNEIFHTSDPLKGWDGKANNGSQKAQQDVYSYLINVVDANQKKHTFVGHVTVVK